MDSNQKRKNARFHSSSVTENTDSNFQLTSSQSHLPLQSAINNQDDQSHFDLATHAGSEMT